MAVTYFDVLKNNYIHELITRTVGHYRIFFLRVRPTVLPKTNTIMKKNFFVAVALLATVMSNAQQSAVASGGEAAGSKGSASFTLGQVAYTAPASDSGSAAQGLQQPYEISEVVSKETQPEGSLLLTTYPNPTTDGVTLDIQNYQQEKLSYVLLSLSGQVLETNTITQNTTAILLKAMAQGTYFLKVTQENTTIKTFKIIKN